MDTKQCSRCKESKALSDFNRNGKKPDGLQLQCRDCQKEYGRSYYSRNKQKFLDYNKTHGKRYDKWLIEYKKTLKCEVCQDTRWYILDFHHKDPSTKLFGIGSAYHHGKGKTKERIMEEIAKCAVLCSNCHREYHYFNGK